MEKSGEQAIGTSPSPGAGAGATKVVIEGGPSAAKALGPGFTKFERIENRRQIVPGAIQHKLIPEGIESSFTQNTANDHLSPMLRTGSLAKPDQEHKKP